MRGCGSGSVLKDTIVPNVTAMQHDGQSVVQDYLMKIFTRIVLKRTSLNHIVFEIFPHRNPFFRVRDVLR